MSLRNSHKLSKPPGNICYFWYGQVVGDTEWTRNHARTNERYELRERDEQQGWAWRCKVAIMGRDPNIVTNKDAKNSELAMAEVLLPTSGGGGIGGPLCSPAVTNNSFVLGIYKDGVSAREPLIIGVFSNIPQSDTLPHDTPETERYKATKGYNSIYNAQNPSSTNTIYGKDLDRCEVFNLYHQRNVCQHDQNKDGDKPFKTSISVACGGGTIDELSGIMTAMDRLRWILSIENPTTLWGQVSDLKKGVNNYKLEIQQKIAAYMKGMIEKMREWTINKLENVVKFFIDLAPPTLRNGIVEGIRVQSDILSCVFTKIIDGLLDIATDIVSDTANKFVNAVECVVENIIGSFFVNILSTISQGISSVLNSLSGIFDSILNISGEILNVLDIIFGLINFITCEEPVDCPETIYWNWKYGSVKNSRNFKSASLKETISLVQSAPERVDSLVDSVSTAINSVGDFSNTVQGAVSSTTQSIEDASNIDVSIGNCFSGPILSGPPLLESLGGRKNRYNPSTSNLNGTDFSANAVVSQSGELIAVDIVNSGDGYSLAPIVVVSDPGGSGSGAVINPRINDSGSVEDFVIIDSGVAYLPQPDGSTGANGRKYANPQDTVVLNEDGYFVFPPCTSIVNVKKGDVLFLPLNSNVQILNSEGEIVQNIDGLGLVTGIQVSESGIFQTPCVTYEESRITSSGPTKSDGSYPVILELDKVFIRSPGSGYNENDKIIVDPPLATIVPKYNDIGQLIEADVVNVGIGYTERPLIYIESDTGFGAQIIPILSVKRVGDLTEDENDLLADSSIVIDVIDCVGAV